jgi:hypothetical protein
MENVEMDMADKRHLQRPLSQKRRVALAARAEKN